MPIQTSDPAQVQGCTLADLGIVFPSGAAIYDSLMIPIEPALRTENLPHLDAFHADETPDQRKRRYDHYAHAFEMFDRAFAEWSNKLSTVTRGLRKTIAGAAESVSKEKDEQELVQLEQVILRDLFPQQAQAA